nr:MAG TPA: hypothetical protein [Caudoviricetes sp.]DAW69429.1 MAG TPA: hypothetical protein [Caudoviricetes sp.]
MQLRKFPAKHQLCCTNSYSLGFNHRAYLIFFSTFVTILFYRFQLYSVVD